METISITKNYVVLSIMNAKSKYLHGECTTNFEVNTICNWMNELFSLSNLNLYIVNELSKHIFEIKNGVIFLNDNYNLESIIDEYKGALSEEYASIVFNEKHMIDRICKYKELQCEYMQKVYQENNDKNYIKQK